MPTLFVPLRKQVRFCPVGPMGRQGRPGQRPGVSLAIGCRTTVLSPVSTPTPRQGDAGQSGLPFERDLKRRGKIHLQIVKKGDTETDYFLLSGCEEQRDVCFSILHA